MMERLLTVNEVKKLIRLGLMSLWSNELDKINLTYKGEVDYNTRSGGYFELSKLKELEGKKFKYPENGEKPKFADNGFILFDYKFFRFWKKALKKTLNFKEIKV